MPKYGIQTVAYIIQALIIIILYDQKLFVYLFSYIYFIILFKEPE